jgi:hypothetical protein
MEPNRAAEVRLSPDATEFVRFCYRRRTVGWPELYDEMCAVASRGLFRGWGPSELAEHGVGFGLFDLPALAGLARQVAAEEQRECRTAATDRRIAVRVAAGSPLTPAAPSTGATPAPTADAAAPTPIPDDVPAEDGLARPHLVPLAS